MIDYLKIGDIEIRPLTINRTEKVFVRTPHMVAIFDGADIIKDGRIQFVNRKEFERTAKQLGVVVA